MRHAVFIKFVLVLATLTLSSVSSAFEKEDERIFDVAHSDSTLRILSNTDLNYFVPLIAEFQNKHPTTQVVYTVASSKELYKAIYYEQANYDLVISSAMDLQVKLVNDGLSAAHQSRATDAMPDWSKWRNHLFAFTQEPAVLVASKKSLDNFELPKDRQELITLLRTNPQQFEGKIGTYDVRESGAGYLFATQDARQSDVYWRLAEVIGSLNPKLYCCSSQMLNDLENGEIAFAYNVVGSYASAVLKDDSNGFIVPLYDYTHFMLRTALIPKRASNPGLGGLFIDFLVDKPARQLIEHQAGLPPINGDELAKRQHYRPIGLGPGLLVYLDKVKRRNFLREWVDAMVQ